MTDFNTTQLKHQNSSTSKPAALADAAGQVEDLSGTERLLNLGRNKSTPKKATKKKATNKPSSKRGAHVAQPTKSVEDALKEGMPSQQLEALLKEWARFNLQEARIQAKAATEALTKVAEAGRRKIADELLKLADGYGISMDDAKAIFAEALEAKRSGRIK